MHRTLKQETLRPPAGTFRKQQTRFDDFLREYNEERPHDQTIVDHARRDQRRRRRILRHHRQPQWLGARRQGIVAFL
jgi:hypothetical protein